LAFCAGKLDNISVVIRSTLLQLLTPDTIQGRVADINSVFIGTSSEIGELKSGVAAQFLEPVLAVADRGAIATLVIIFVAYHWPVVRRLQRLEDLQPSSTE